MRGVARFHPNHIELSARAKKFWGNARRKRKAQFSIVTASPKMDDVKMSSDDNAPSHEARLIPGLIPGKIYGFPNSIITKLRYYDCFNQTSTLGGVARNLWRANSIFDPDQTNAGHQPMYRDQWATIYNHYVVIGSKITVTFVPTSATVPMVCGVAGDDDSSTSTTPQTLVEQNNSKHVVIGTTGSEPKTVTMTFEPVDAFGVDTKDDGRSLTATGSNPFEEWYFCTYAFTLDGASTATVGMAVEIEYTVKFAELVTPTQS